MIPTHIIVHHSLTEDGSTVSWNAIRKYHLAQGWIDIGYHFGIERIGDVYEILAGRMMNETGAHTVGMNSCSMGICCVGNFDISPLPTEQLDTLVKLTKTLMVLFSIPKEHVKRHSDYASYKSCPGTQFPWDTFHSRL